MANEPFLTPSGAVPTGTPTLASTIIFDDGAGPKYCSLTTVKALLGVTSGGLPAGGTGGTGGTVAIDHVTLSNIPNLLHVLDPALPVTTQALTPGTAGIQIDGTANVSAIIEPKSKTNIVRGFGAVSLAQGGTGNWPYFHGAVDALNQGFDSFKFPLPTAEAIFGPAKNAWHMMFVMRSTGPGFGNLVTCVAPSGAFNVIAPGGTVVDGALRLEQNNSSAVGTEPSSAATALNVWQIVSIMCDGTRYAIYRNGTQTFQTPTANNVSGLSGATKWEIANAPRADIALILIAAGAPSVAQHNAEVQRLASAYGITGISAVTAGPATAIPAKEPSIFPFFAQALVFPTVKVGAGNAVVPSSGVTLVTPNSCTFNADFTNTGNIRNHTQLFASHDYLAIYGNLTSATDNTRKKGFVPAMFSEFARYPEYYADGVTPDPRNLHVFKSDNGGYLELQGRGIGNTASDMTKVEAGMIVPVETIKSGMFIEAKMRFSGERNAWPAFWAFDGAMERLASYSGYPRMWDATAALEIDFADGFSPDGQPGGVQLPIGTPYPYSSSNTTAIDAMFGNPNASPPYAFPQDTFRKATGSPRWNAADPFSKYIVDAPTLAERDFTFFFDWRDRNTMVWGIDGVVLKKKRIFHAANYKAADNVGRASPAELIGTELPMTPILGMQVSAQFNPSDRAFLPQQTGFGRWKMRVYWLRIWNSTSTIEPVGATADLTVNPRF